MNTLIISLKEYSIGFAIFLIPIISFMSQNNLRQLGTFDLYLILTSLIAILLVLLIFSTLLQYSIIKIFKTRPHSIFLLSCFGFYLLFLFTPIYEIAIITIFQKGNAVYFTLFFLFLIWLTTLILVLHFQKFGALFQRSMFIFACINFLFSLIFNTEFVTKIWDKSNVLELKTNSLLEFEDSDLLKPVDKSNNHNVYYIILDEMIALDYAAKMGFVNKVKQKEALEQSGLIYIDHSYSNYDSTSHTLAAIMEIDYLTLDNSTSMGSRIFPSMMQQKNKRIPLPELISKAGSEFVWMGTVWGPCVEWTTQPWTCIHSNKLRYLSRLSHTIYLGTPLKRILELIHLESGQRNIKLYIELLKKNKKTNNLQFVFIHQMSPHDPYTVTENCKQQVAPVINLELKNKLQENWEKEYKGYKASYRCVLKEVLDFMEYISTADPGAIVVFQADHGFRILKDKTKTSEDIFHYRAAIFNAIKAPETCFKKFGEPHSNINTVRFILNCAYGYELSYLPSTHYRVVASPSSANKISLQETNTLVFQP